MTTTVGKKQNVELEQSEIVALRTLVQLRIQMTGAQIMSTKRGSDDERHLKNTAEMLQILDTKLGLAEGKIN